MKKENYHKAISNLYLKQTQTTIESNSFSDKWMNIISMMIDGALFSIKNKEFTGELDSTMKHLIDIRWVQKVEVVQGSGNYSYQIRDIFKEKFFKYILNNSFLISDVTEKIKPINNFIALVEVGADRQFIFKNIDSVKESIFYLCNRKNTNNDSTLY